MNRFSSSKMTRIKIVANLCVGVALVVLRVL